MAHSNVNNQAASPKVENNPNVGTGDSLMKISCGPAALAQKLIYEIMAMYAEITDLDQKQKVSTQKAQLLEVQGQAAATKAGAADAGSMMIGAGISTAVGAGLGVAFTFAGTVPGMKSTSKQQSELESQMKPMKNIDELMKSEDPAALTRGVSTKSNEVLEDGQLIAEFKNGNYTNADHQDAGSAIAALKNSPEEFQAFKEQHAKELNRLTTEHNTVGQGLSSMFQKVNLVGNTISTVGQSTGTTMQGIGTQNKGEQDALATLNGTAQQQAGSTANDFGQAMSKAYEAQNAEVQILERIHQTNNVRG